VDDALIDSCVLNGGEHEVAANLERGCDVIIAQGMSLERFPALRYSDRVVVVDMYTPFVIENLAYTRAARRADADTLNEQSNDAINNQLAAGDFFICASERQRDFWLGGLLAQSRINPDTYGDDDQLRRLIDVVPFGVSSVPPAHTRRVLKGVWPGIGADDTLLLWNGGIWEWFDPLTLLRALACVRERRPTLRLFFMGSGHPHSAVVPPMPMEAAARALAQELGLLDEVVFFNDGWVPYGERASYLLEADLAVSAHFDSAETRLAFRTRLLDCIWAGLPMIVSAGDTLAELVDELDLGMVVAPGDVDGWANALLELSVLPDRRQHFAPAFEQARERLHWERVLEPLVRFCRAPRHAADSLRQRHRLHEKALAMTIKQQQAQTQYVTDLEAQIARKNEHIANLERTILALESGAVMKILRRLNR
jgi:glycosyltransferase involved in cell wall biosynthesis